MIKAGMAPICCFVVRLDPEPTMNTTSSLTCSADVLNLHRRTTLTLISAQTVVPIASGLFASPCI
jgi:hypothetical protein